MLCEAVSDLNELTPDEIEETERSWHLAIAKVAGNDLSQTMLEALLSMQRTERLASFEDADEIMRTMGVQIRLNSAIQEGDKNMATRVIASYLGGSTPQFKN